MTFQTNFIAMLDHVGTHVDAYRHVNPKGRAGRRNAARNLHGQGGVLRPAAYSGPRRHHRADMEAAEKKAGVKVDGHIVLLCTGFHQRNYPSLDSVWKNPLLTVEATRLAL